MATAQVSSPTAGDRIADTVGRAAHVAHDVRVLKTLAADAIEDGVREARRAVTRGRREIGEWRETTAYRIKKAPFLAVGIAAGAGLLIGMICGRFGPCGSSRTP